jgi:hypothetical protein
VCLDNGAIGAAQLASPAVASGEPPLSGAGARGGAALDAPPAPVQGACDARVNAAVGGAPAPAQAPQERGIARGPTGSGRLPRVPLSPSAAICLGLSPNSGRSSCCSGAVLGSCCSSRCGANHSYCCASRFVVLK